MSIAVIDTNIMIYLFEHLYSMDKHDFQRAVDYFRTRFGEMWIPEEVRREFTVSSRMRKRLDRIMNRHGNFIRKCPIKTSKNERDIIINGIDIGEADAIVQMQKALSKRRYSIRNFVFVSQDKAALRFAKDTGFEVLQYEEIKQELREIGVVI